MTNNRPNDSSLLLSVQSQSVRSLRTAILVSFGLLFGAALIITHLGRTFGIPLTSYEGSYAQERAQMLSHLSLVADLKKERLLLWLNERKQDGSQREIATLLPDEANALKSMLETGERIGKTEEIFLVDDKARALTPLNQSFPDGAPAIPPETLVDGEAAKRAAAGEEGVYIGPDYRGVPILAAYRTIPVMPGRSWGMVIKVNQEEVFALLWERVLYSLLISLFGLLAAGILAVFVANRITKPLHDLQSTAMAVAGGDLAARAQATGSRETRIFAEVFNAMVQRVEHWYGELQNEVRTRTLELSTTNSALATEIAERKEAQETLARERERLSVTLRSIGDGVISTDTAGRVISVNQAAELLTGWMEKEAVDRPLTEVFRIVNEHTGEICHNPVGQVMSTGQIVGLCNHTALLARDGTERAIADSAAPIRGTDGHTFGVVLVFRDVTEHRMTEDALLKSEEKYRTLFDTTPDGISLTSRDGRLIEANQSLLDLFGYTREEIPEIDLRNVYVQSADRKAFQDAVERQGSVKDYAVKMRKKDGTELDCLFTSTVQRDTHGVIVGYRNIVRDITDQKRTYEKLKESEERFRAIFNSDHAVMLIIDPETGSIEDASPGACTFYGYGREELRTKKVSVHRDPPSEE